MDTRGGMSFIVVLYLLFVVVSSKIAFHEEFGKGWESRWTKTKWKEEQQGEFIHTQGKWYGDTEKAWGIQTADNMKFYEISSKLKKPFSSKDTPLVIQYSVKFEQVIDCGGGYIKLVGEDYDPKNFGGETPLLIMFGPDICGGDNKVHLIIDHKGKGYLWKKKPTAPNDKLTHIYTAAIFPNGSYSVYLDAKPLENGTILEDWEFSAPKEIPDPNDKKPDDWDDRKNIPDPEDRKPDDWDDKEMIEDNSATKPEDWDDQKEGEWQPPKIRNPNYKGPWEPKTIYNPSYSGVWSPKMVPNPEYNEGEEVDIYTIGGVGIDVWQVKAGTIYDNILIADSLEDAIREAEVILEKQVKKESEFKEEDDKEEQKKAEEAREKMKSQQKDEEEEKKPDL